MTVNTGLILAALPSPERIMSICVSIVSNHTVSLTSDKKKTTETRPNIGAQRNGSKRRPCYGALPSQMLAKVACMAAGVGRHLCCSPCGCNGATEDRFHSTPGFHRAHRSPTTTS